MSDIKPVFTVFNGGNKFDVDPEEVTPLPQILFTFKCGKMKWTFHFWESQQEAFLEMATDIQTKEEVRELCLRKETA